MDRLDIAYEALPRLIKDNLSAAQWEEAQPDIIMEGELTPETTDYINIKNGQIHTCLEGETAPGPLLPVHDLSGGAGRDSTQFHTTPPGAKRP